MRASRATLALAIAATLLAAGCGGSDERSSGERSPDERAAVRAALKAAHDALYSAEAEEFCDRLSASARAATTGGTCEEAVMAVVPQPLPERTIEDSRSTILSVRLEGDRATVRTRSSGGEILPVSLVKENGHWKMDAPWKDLGSGGGS